MTKEKGRTPQTESTTPGTSTAADSTAPAIDPLAGWFALGKESREKRKPKRGWKRQQPKQRGFLQPDFGDMALIAVTVVLMATVAWRLA